MASCADTSHHKVSLYSPTKNIFFRKKQALCNNRLPLEHELKIFHQYVQQVRKNALKKEARAEQSTKEHMAVMEAIKAHNADEADRLATRHILNSIKNHHYTKIEKLLEEQP